MILYSRKYIYWYLNVVQMGYGSRALELMEQYYGGLVPSLAEDKADDPKEVTTVDKEVNTSIAFSEVVYI